MCGLVRGGSHLHGETRLQFVFAQVQQAAVGVVDDDELLRVEQVVRHDQGAKSIVRGDAPGVADHVGVTGMQPEAVLEKNARVHAGQDGNVPLGADGEISQSEIAGEGFVGF